MSQKWKKTVLKLWKRFCFFFNVENEFKSAKLKSHVRFLGCLKFLMKFCYQRETKANAFLS